MLYKLVRARYELSLHARLRARYRSDSGTAGGAPRVLLPSALSLSGSITPVCRSVRLAVGASLWRACALGQLSRVPEKPVLRERRPRCSLVAYRPLAKAQSTAAKSLRHKNSVGLASEAVLSLAQYRRSSVSPSALRVGTLASHSCCPKRASACIGNKASSTRRQSNAVDAARKRRRRCVG